MNRVYTITFDIDLTDNKYDEIEPTGEFRSPEHGDMYISKNGDVLVHNGSDPMAYPHVIVRPKFTPPAWIPSGWFVARDGSGFIHGFSEIPAYDAKRRVYKSLGGVDVPLSALFEANGVVVPSVSPQLSIWQQG